MIEAVAIENTSIQAVSITSDKSDAISIENTKIEAVEE